MEYQTYLSYPIVAIIWLAIIIITAVLYYLFPDETYYWNKVCDKCNPSTAKYRYVIRFIFKSFKPTFELSKTTITIEICDKNGVLVILQIIPTLLESFIADCPNQSMKMVRLLLYRDQQLKDVSHVVINHNGSGSINVATIEIQDTNEKIANIAYVGNAVESMNKDRANVAQRYPSAARDLRSIEPELKPCISLNSMEFMIYFFLVINLMLVLTVYLIPCIEDMLCNDYREGFISSAFSGLTASTIGGLVFILCCSFHRYVIKKCMFKRRMGCTSFKYLVLLIAIMIGTVTGITSALSAANGRKFPYNYKELPHEFFWLFAVVIALVVFFLFWITILLVVGRCIGFFSEPDESEFEPDSKTVRTDSELEDESPDYMTKLIKTNTKVHSISQYAGIKSKDVKQTTIQKEKSVPKSNIKTVQRTPSSESTGSGYYKELMKGKGKVKSVSQYQGTSK